MGIPDVKEMTKNFILGKDVSKEDILIELRKTLEIKFSLNDKVYKDGVEVPRSADEIKRITELIDKKFKA